MSDRQLITFLLVSDLERSHDFYSGTLGLALSVDQGDCRIYRVGGDAFLGVCERPDQVDPDGVIVTIVTDEVEETHERMSAGGASVVEGPRHNGQYGITHAFYRDPDGILVEVQRFDDPDWAQGG